MIVLGQNLGAILGTRVADLTLGLTGSSSFMPLAAAVFLGLSIVLTLWVDSRQSPLIRSATPPLLRDRLPARATK